MDYKKIGKALRKTRGNKSLKDIAEQSGLAVMTISNIERGISVKEDTYRKVLNVYGYNYDSVFLAEENIKKTILQIVDGLLFVKNDLALDKYNELCKFNNEVLLPVHSLEIKFVSLLIEMLISKKTEFTKEKIDYMDHHLEDLSIKELKDYVLIVIEKQKLEYSEHTYYPEKLINIISNGEYNNSLLGLSCIPIADYYSKSGLYYDASKYLIKAEENFALDKNENRLLTCRLSIANLCTNCFDFRTAEKIYLSILSKNQIDERITKIVKQNLGWAYYLDENYEKTMNLFTDSKVNNLSGDALFLLMWSLYITDRGKMLVNFLEKNKGVILSSDNIILNAFVDYVENKQSADIEFKLLKYLDKVKEDNDRQNIIAIYRILINYYENIGEFKLANNYNKFLVQEFFYGFTH